MVYAISKYDVDDVDDDDDDLDIAIAWRIGGGLINTTPSSAVCVSCMVYAISSVCIVHGVCNQQCVYRALTHSIPSLRVFMYTIVQ
jgi:hypothetical protein